jgi:ubiquinol oxidase
VCRPDEDECPLFLDKEGKLIQPMCADYGFRSGAGRLYMDHYGETPGSVWDLVRAAAST